MEIWETLPCLCKIIIQMFFLPPVPSSIWKVFTPLMGICYLPSFKNPMSARNNGRSTRKKGKFFEKASNFLMSLKKKKGGFKVSFVCWFNDWLGECIFKFEGKKVCNTHEIEWFNACFMGFFLFNLTKKIGWVFHFWVW